MGGAEDPSSLPFPSRSQASSSLVGGGARGLAPSFPVLGRPAWGRACRLGTWVGLSPGTQGPEAHWLTFRLEPPPSQGS